MDEERKEQEEEDILFLKILTEYFADELGESYELTDGYYGRFIEEIEDTDDILTFAENLTEDLRDDYGGKLSEDERSKFHHALMFNSMTIAWKNMVKHQIKDGVLRKDEFDKDELDITKGLVSNEHYNEL